MGWNRIIVALPVEPLGKPAAAAASLWNGHLREEEEEAEDGPRRPQSFRWEGKQRSSWVLSDLLANWTLSLWRRVSGFSVNASSERLNMGEIETPEDP